MPQEDEQSVIRIVAGFRDLATTARSRRRFDPQDLAQLLVVCLGAIECSGELLDAAVLHPKTCYLALEAGHARRTAGDGSGICEEQYDQHCDHEGAPLPSQHRPAWQPV